MAKLGKYSANGFKSCNLTLLLTYIIVVPELVNTESHSTS